MGLLSHTTLTLNDCQGYSNWYQHAECNGVCLHIKFERNCGPEMSERKTMCFPPPPPPPPPLLLL